MVAAASRFGTFRPECLERAGLLEGFGRHANVHVTNCSRSAAFNKG